MEKRKAAVDAVHIVIDDVRLGHPADKMSGPVASTLEHQTLQGVVTSQDVSNAATGGKAESERGAPASE